MINKRRRPERARSATQPRNYIQERVSFGEDAKQTLHNLSLINNHNEQARQWTKEEDNLSIASFQIDPNRSLSPNLERGGLKFKKVKLNTRNSTPVISNAALSAPKRQQRKQLVPNSLDINNNLSDQRIHSGSHYHNFVGGKQLHLFNEVVFRRTAAAIARSFRPATLPHARHHDKFQKSLGNYLELSCKSGCNKIVPLHVNDLSKGLGRNEEKKITGREQVFASSKANIVRKLLKEQRKSNFNESIFRKEAIRPEF